MKDVVLHSKSEIFDHIDQFLQTNNNGVLEILGPTASGKTAFAIEVAKRLGNGEVLSVDSRQVYQDMRISSVMVSPQEMQGVPHHGLELVTPEQNYSVVDFQRYAFETIEQIQSRGNIPILCGGTMLWLDAVSENYIFAHQKEVKSTEKGASKWPFLKIGLHWDRNVLYGRINRRAGEQFEAGLMEETKTVLEKYNITKSAFTSFGYQEIKAYLDGEITYDEALAANQKRNRNYAKRQLTWWRGREDIVWLYF